MDLIHKAHVGFVYVYECFDTNGKLKWRDREENIIPNVGRDYMLTAALLAGSQLPNWYIGLYENTRTPLVGDTMTTLMADCGEVTTYTSAGSLRLALVPDALSSGVFSNLSTPAEFVFTAAKTIKGGFISSSAAWGATSGTLLSAVANSSPKSVGIGETLRVTAGLSLTTV
jgi:hypothetical protein